MNDPRRLRAYSGNPKRNNFFRNLSYTNLLIIINVVFFIISFPLIISSAKYLNYLAINPANFFSGKYVWTILTSMFVHGNLLHLFVNMFVLFSLGSLCERIIGRKRFLGFYLISGIIAGLMFVTLAYLFGGTPLGARIFGAPDSYAVGASGAIFAIAGLFMVLTPKLKFSIIFLPFFSLPAYIMIPIVLFLTWIISSSIGGGVGNTAHLGGFLAGVVYGLYLRNRYKRKAKFISEYFS